MKSTPAKVSALRREDLERRAYALAVSGEHLDHTSIEPVLIAEGFGEAHDWLSLDSVRADIKALCDAARRRAKKAKRPSSAPPNAKPCSPAMDWRIAQ